MILRIGDTQEVPGVGVFEWDGREFWVLDKTKSTNGGMYVLLKNMGLEFSVKSGKKESD